MFIERTGKKVANIAIRADGGPKVGMGHIMRCLALAGAFPEKHKIMFITKDEKSVRDILSQKGYKQIILSKQYKNIDDEINEVTKILEKHKIDILITDSYKIDQKYLIEMKKAVDKLVTIHDFAPFAFPSDIVINGNIYAEDLNYKSLYRNTKFLLGPKYTLLREEFQNLPKRKINKQVKNILVTVGGSDLLNITPKVISALNLLSKSNIEKEYCDLDRLHVDIVIGPAFNNITDIIQKVSKSNLEISLNYNVKKMSTLMLKSDLAISAGGSTLYELAATGTPTITLLQADNQNLVAVGMEKAGFIINLGLGDNVNAEHIIDDLINIINDFQLRKNMSSVGQKRIDGKGTIRACNIILETG